MSASSIHPAFIPSLTERRVAEKMKAEILLLRDRQSHAKARLETITVTLCEFRLNELRRIARNPLLWNFYLREPTGS